MTSCIAVINAGSSSIKFGLYKLGSETPLFRGKVEQIGISPLLEVTDAKEAKLIEKHWPAKDVDHRAATQEILDTCRSLIEGAQIAAVGHRVVHGGTKYAQPTRIDQTVV